VPYSEKIKSGYKDLAGRWLFFVWRRVERRLSPQVFYSILKPFSFARATMNCAFRKRRYATSRPDFLRVTDPARAERQQRMNDYLNDVLEFFPDQLGEEKWAQNCRVEGLERLQSAFRNKRPTVLACCHFGAFELSRFWLRAKGIPATALRGGKAESRRLLMRLKDRFSPFPEVPIALYGDQMRAIDEFVAAGNLLLVAIDSPVQKQIDVPFCEGWTFQMAAGAVRLAARHSADLIPLSVVDEGHWKFTIKLGEPVPRELFLPNNGWRPAAKYLIDQMIPIFRAWPEQCRPDLIRCLKLSDEQHHSQKTALR
jgi:lauroyl/myristoyl acyltransferase